MDLASVIEFSATPVFFPNDGSPPAPLPSRHVARMALWLVQPASLLALPTTPRHGIVGAEACLCQ